MSQTETSNPLFTHVAAQLPSDEQAEYYRVLHEVGVDARDVELARLLKALQLYRAYYESIPAAVQAAAGDIARLKEEIATLSQKALASTEASAQLLETLTVEAGHVHQELAQIHKHVQEAIRQSATELALQMGELLEENIEQTVLVPLQSRLADLASSSHAMDEAIQASNDASAALAKQASLARRVHFGAYGLAALVLACSVSLVSWLFIHRAYTHRLERERQAMVQETEKNRKVLLRLAEAGRTLELVKDPKRPRKRFLVMRNASGWSAQHQGVIEFSD